MKKIIVLASVILFSFTSFSLPTREYDKRKPVYTDIKPNLVEGSEQSPEYELTTEIIYSPSSQKIAIETTDRLEMLRHYLNELRSAEVINNSTEDLSEEVFEIVLWESKSPGGPPIDEPIEPYQL